MKLSDLTKKRIRIAYSAVLSVMIAVTGVLFAVSCYNISSSGDHPFTVESVSAAFDKIKIPVFLTLAALVGSVALHFIAPEREAKLKAHKMNGALLRRLTESLDSDRLSEEQKTGINKEKKLRLILGRIMITLVVLSVILPLFYLLNPNNFPAEDGKYNSEILHGMLFYAISLSPLLVYSIVCGVLTERSILREIGILKEAKRSLSTDSEKEKNSKVQTDTKNLPSDGLRAALSYLSKNKKPILLGVRISFFAAAVLFIVVGAVSGGSESVLIKAVKICTECIGLG